MTQETEEIEVGKNWGWWITFDKLDQFETDMAKLVPHPGRQRLIDINREYTQFELSNMLQSFSSYLATLHYTQGMIEAQCHALKESMKTALQVSISKEEKGKGGTKAELEGKIISDNDLLNKTRKMQIDHEATLILLNGWAKAYEDAYTGVSRMVSISISDMNTTPGNERSQ